MKTSPRIRRWLDQLLHTHDTPERTAAAYALGVFFGFSPLLGLHTVLAIIIAFAFRLNRVAVLAGAWVNVWALAPCYAFGTLLGALLLGVDASDLKAIDWSQGIGALGSTFGTLLWPIVVGNTLLGLVVGTAAYALCRKFLEARAARAKVEPDSYI